MKERIETPGRSGRRALEQMFTANGAPCERVIELEDENGSRGENKRTVGDCGARAPCGLGCDSLVLR